MATTANRSRAAGPGRSSQSSPALARRPGRAGFLVALRLVIVGLLLALALGEGLLAAVLPPAAPGPQTGPVVRTLPSVGPAEGSVRLAVRSGGLSDGHSVGTALGSGFSARSMPLSFVAPSPSPASAKAPAARITTASDATAGVGRSGSRGGWSVARLLALGANGLAAVQSLSFDTDLPTGIGLAALLSAVFNPASGLGAVAGGLVEAMLAMLLTWTVAVASVRISEEYLGRLTFIYTRPSVRPD
ncbi:MAG: hypothetical protein M3Z25_07355 [Actinomycetota bacterium]|nr:hypothetical protein [Actinomycetota bacterium]